MTVTRRAHALAFVVVASATLGTTAAHANGRFPFGNSIVVDPSDPTRIVERATYGILQTRDNGATWSWICEGGAGYKNADPALGIMADGTIIAATPTGLSHNKDQWACDWPYAGDPLLNQQVADLVVEHGTPSHALAITTTAMDGSFHNIVAETLDNAASWHVLGAALPDDVTLQTIEVAESDPQRLYVSAIKIPSTVLLEESKDRAGSWNALMPAWDSGATAAWVSAIDPNDPGKVYIRLQRVTQELLADSTNSDQLGVYTESTGDWKVIFTSAGTTDMQTAAAHGLVGFALSPDGTKIAVGGYDDNLHIITVGTWTDQKVGNTHPQCLRWTSAGLYECGFEPLDLFTAGLSQDDGTTFTPIAHFPVFCEPDCAANTTTGMVCPMQWGLVETGLDFTQNVCGSDGGGGGAGTQIPPDGSSGGAGGGAGASGGKGGAAGAAGGVGGNGASTGASDAGTSDTANNGSSCSCSLPKTPERGRTAVIFASLLAMGALSRRSTKKRARR